MPTSQSYFFNDFTMVIEGSFDLSASAAVLTLTYPAGQTKTVRGKGMTVTKTGTGTYAVVVKTSSTISGPTFQAVEFVGGDAGLVGATVATALGARLGGIPTLTSAGDITFNVITLSSTGAAVDTTGAITVTFEVEIITNRMDLAL